MRCVERKQRGLFLSGCDGCRDIPSQNFKQVLHRIRERVSKYSTKKKFESKPPGDTKLIPYGPDK